MRYYFIGLVLAVLAVLAVAGFRGDKTGRPPIELFPDMDRQEKVKPQKPSEFFADGRGARMPVEGTIPLKANVENEYLATGKMGSNWGDGIPVELTLATLKRGRERYTISCQICHGATGAGTGITGKYGMNPANLQQEMYRSMSDGEIFNTITHGKNTMFGYGANITPEDRWAIIAWLRVLQRSQNATLADVPETERAQLQTAP
jgi:mono/diheme cytochrome c family protein